MYEPGSTSAGPKHSVIGPERHVGELPQRSSHRRWVFPEVPSDPIHPRKRGAGESPHHLPLEIEDLAGDHATPITGIDSILAVVSSAVGVAGPRAAHPVRQEEAGRPLLPPSRIRFPATVPIRRRRASDERGRRLEEKELELCGPRISGEFPEGPDVVEHISRSPVGRDHQIVVTRMQDEVVHSHGRQPVSPRHPIHASIQG